MGKAGSTILLFIIVIGFQNCAPAFHNLEEQTLTSLSISEKMSCKFVGPNVIQDRIRSKLGVMAGDFPTLMANGQENAAVTRLTSSLSALGKGNPSQGTFDDYSCGAVKYKAAMEVMVDACAYALKSTQAKLQIFPRGVHDYEELYMRFIGRVPTHDENQILRDLVDQVDSEKREAAACAAVASSLEALITI